MQNSENLRTRTTRPLRDPEHEAAEVEYRERHARWLAEILSGPAPEMPGLALDRSDASMPGHMRTRHNLRRGGFRY